MLHIEEGSVLFGKYRIVKKVGEGSFAKVYLSIHIKLNTYRAIKCILKKDMLYEQLMREVNILRDIKHDNIPTIYDIEEDEDSAYIIEEFCEGPSLKEYVSSGRLDGINKVVDFSLQISRLLEYLHSHEQHILYLDLKPDNLIISNGVIKLIDFGAAVIGDEIGRQGAYYGSISFGSPEQRRGRKVDNRSDVYSFGKLLLYMLEGVKDNNKRKTLEKVANRCLCMTPMLRYKDMNCVKMKLKAISMNKEVAKEEREYGHMRVCICESVEGIGAFEMSLMMMLFLKEKIGTSYVDLSGQENIEEMANYLNLVEESQSVYSYKGCSIYKSLEYVIDTEAVVINYGAQLLNCTEGLWDWDIVICLCQGRVWNTKRAKELLLYLNICDELRIVVDSDASREMIRKTIGTRENIYVFSGLRGLGENLELDDKQREWLEKLLDNKT